MITIQAKASCDYRGCKESTNITLSFEEEEVLIGTDGDGENIWYDRINIQVHQSPPEWDINTTTSKNWCPKHNGRTPL